MNRIAVTENEPLTSLAVIITRPMTTNMTPIKISINLIISPIVWGASPLKTYEKVGSVAGPGARGVNPGTPLGP